MLKSSNGPFLNVVPGEQNVVGKSNTEKQNSHNNLILF